MQFVDWEMGELEHESRSLADQVDSVVDIVYGFLSSTWIIIFFTVYFVIRLRERLQFIFIVLWCERQNWRKKKVGNNVQADGFANHSIINGWKRKNSFHNSHSK